MSPYHDSFDIIMMNGLIDKQSTILCSFIHKVFYVLQALSLIRMWGSLKNRPLPCVMREFYLY